MRQNVKVGVVVGATQLLICCCNKIMRRYEIKYGGTNNGCKNERIKWLDSSQNYADGCDIN